MKFLIYEIPTESKEGQVKSDDLGKDIISVQALLVKHVRYIMYTRTVSV